MTTSTPPLTGLELPAPPQTDIEAQVEATISELRRLDLLAPRHEAQVGLCRLLARKLGVVAGHGQAYGVAMLARELREALAALPTIPEGQEEADEFAALVASVRDAQVGHQPGPQPVD